MILWKNGAYYDGQTPTISHMDSGLTNGLGIFDSCLVQDGTALDFKDHYARLIHDTKTVLRAPENALLSFEKAKEIAQSLIRKNEIQKSFARLKIIVTGGLADRPLQVSHTLSVLITLAPCPPPDTISAAKCVIIGTYTRVAGDPLENCKRLDYSRSYAARQDAIAQGADDAILINTKGKIACGTTSNLFIREGTSLITPPLSDGVLAGITRKKILATENAREESISLERLFNADSVFLTNSFVGKRPVTLMEIK